MRRIAASLSEHVPTRHSCYDVSAKEVRAHRLCRTGHTSTPPSFVIWGDSHARALVEPVAKTARLYERVGVISTKPGCAPLLGIRRSDRQGREECNEIAVAMIEYVRARPEIEDVVLIGRWALFSEGTFYAPEQGVPHSPVRSGNARAQPCRESSRLRARAFPELSFSSRPSVSACGSSAPFRRSASMCPRHSPMRNAFSFEVALEPLRAEFEIRQRRPCSKCSPLARRLDCFSAAPGSGREAPSAVIAS